MPEITPDDLKWLEKLDGRIWNADLNLDTAVAKWVVSVGLPATAMFVVRGVQTDGNNELADNDVVQDILARYPAVALTYVDSKVLRQAIRKAKVTLDSMVMFDLPASGSASILGYDLSANGNLESDSQPVNTVVIDVPTNVLHDIRFRINARLWIDALMGFTGDVMIAVRPTASGVMFTLTQNGDRHAYIMGYHTDSEDQYDDLSSGFWENRTCNAITQVRGLSVVTYGELLELGKSIDLSFYQENNYSPEGAAYELAFNLDQLRIEETACLKVGDIVTSVLFSLPSDKARNWRISEYVEKMDGFRLVDPTDETVDYGYPLYRKDLRLVK